MNTLIRNDIRRNVKTIIIASLLISFLVFGSMFFYSAVRDSFSYLEGFFQETMLKNIFVAFGINPSSLQSILGFYATYSSMWVVLIGSIFFSYFAYDLIANEEKNGVSEYLITRPLLRSDIYKGKLLVLISSILLFMIILSIFGFSALEMQKKFSPHEINMKIMNVEIKDSFIANSASMSSLLNLDEDDFGDFVNQLILREYESNKDEMPMDLDNEQIGRWIDTLTFNPEQVMIELKENPEYFMREFEVEGMPVEEFVLEVEKTVAEYSLMKEIFISEDVIIEFFDIYPEFFLNKIISDNIINEANRILGIDLVALKLFEKYNINDFFILHINMFLGIFICSILSFVYGAVRYAKKSSSQHVMIAILALYFIYNISGISEKSAFLSKLTPFGYVNLEVTSVNYSISLITLIGITVGTSLVVFICSKLYDKKDFL
jgi:hypothetical protein